MEIQENRLVEAVEAIHVVKTILGYGWVVDVFLKESLSIHVKQPDFFETFPEHETEISEDDFAVWEKHYVIFGGVEFFCYTIKKLKEDHND